MEGLIFGILRYNRIDRVSANTNAFRAVFFSIFDLFLVISL